MCFDCSTKGKVQISMDKSIANIINALSEKIMGVSATPANNNLFKVWSKGKKLLPKSKAAMFHQTVVQLLYISNHIH